MKTCNYYVYQAQLDGRLLREEPGTRTAALFPAQQLPMDLFNKSSSSINLHRKSYLYDSPFGKHPLHASTLVRHLPANECLSLWKCLAPWVEKLSYLQSSRHGLRSSSCFLFQRTITAINAQKRQLNSHLMDVTNISASVIKTYLLRHIDSEVVHQRQVYAPCPKAATILRA